MSDFSGKQIIFHFFLSRTPDQVFSLGSITFRPSTQLSAAREVLDYLFINTKSYSTYFQRKKDTTNIKYPDPVRINPNFDSGKIIICNNTVTQARMRGGVGGVLSDGRPYPYRLPGKGDHGRPNPSDSHGLRAVASTADQGISRRSARD